MKTLIVGNGIDIQYGGIEQRGNNAILARAMENIKSGKYDKLGWEKKYLLDIFETCLKVINRVIDKKWSVKPSEDFVFLQKEMERVRRYYKTPCKLDTLGLEDYFLGAELAILNVADSELEVNDLQKKVFTFLRAIMLDAIYDDGKINDIYKKFPSKLVSELQKYDEIYTINYDTNLENALEGKVPIYHLHGCFDEPSNEIHIMDEYRHMFCNGIMSWYWLDKYDGEGKDGRYGIKQFEQIEGIIDIIGVSPCNDEQLYVRISGNSKLNCCNFYYYDRNDAVEIRKHIFGNLSKHITEHDVKKYWSKFDNY